jgi:hypothetical protein
MATWTTLPDASLEPGKPIRSIDGLALRDNPIAISEGAAGAPKIQTAALITGEQMTTANVLNATAGAAAGAVGTYALAVLLSGGAVSFGSTTSGSNLRPSSSAASPTGSALSGTWRCMGVSAQAADSTGVTLWLRIS